MIVLVKDKSDVAFAEFKKIHASPKDGTDEHIIEAEFMLLRAQVAHEMNEAVPLSAFWTRKSLRKRCIVGFLTFFAGQGTATLVINSLSSLPRPIGLPIDKCFT